MQPELDKIKRELAVGNYSCKKQNFSKLDIHNIRDFLFARQKKKYLPPIQKHISKRHQILLLQYR